MTYSVYQHWDPLNVCVVGRSYPPEFYSWIENSRLRSLFERIAIETEEDFINVQRKLEEFNVKVVRPNTPNVLVDSFLTSNNRVPGPTGMIPRDQMTMIGENFFLFPHEHTAIKSSGRSVDLTNWTQHKYDQLKGPDWPDKFTKFLDLPDWIKHEITEDFNITVNDTDEHLEEIVAKAGLLNWWGPVIDEVKANGNKIYTNLEDSALNLLTVNGIWRIGRDLYLGTSDNVDKDMLHSQISEKYFPEYRCHYISTYGHIDGCFSPLVPGLILSVEDMDSYAKTFPDWEVVYLKGESWSKVKPFLELKKHNQGKWWIKGHEYDDELTQYVESWLSDWVGYVEESVFDVNILVIDEKNVIVSNHNKKAFDAFERYSITPHICPLRHRYFWDGGLHCITADLDRTGKMQDYFNIRAQS